MKNPFHEFRVFMSYPHNMRVLLITNLVFGFVMPISESFIGAYIFRNSQDPAKVITYQLATYLSIPFTFLLNGFLLQFINVRRLYSLGMLINGISMICMMALPQLTLPGLALAGLLMGMALGFYWANRDFLALSSTADSNRNYYYGLENFFSTAINIGLPAAVGAFILLWQNRGSANRGYHIVIGLAFVLAMVASWVIHHGKFENPPRTKFLYFRFHWLWYRMQLLAVLKGAAQGYIVTAPMMLTMKLVGTEASYGAFVTGGTVISAILLYILGRTTGPQHRVYILSLGLFFFVLGAGANSIFYSVMGVVIFTVCGALGRPLADTAYFTIQMLVIDTVSTIEKRNKYAYLFNQEFGFLVGRMTGCGLFLILTYYVSETFALRYSILIIFAIQLLSIPVARMLLRGCAKCTVAPADQLAGA